MERGLRGNPAIRLLGLGLPLEVWGSKFVEDTQSVVLPHGSASERIPWFVCLLVSFMNSSSNSLQVWPTTSEKETVRNHLTEVKQCIMSRLERWIWAAVNLVESYSANYKLCVPRQAVPPLWDCFPRCKGGKMMVMVMTVPTS